MTPWETLGVSPDADAETIRAAYRLLAQRNHPDRGGSKAIMQQIQTAYDTLTNPQVDDQKLVKLLAQLLGSVFQELGNKGKDLDHHDPIQMARSEMHGALKVGAKAQTDITKTIVQREKALKRLSQRKGGAVDHLRLVLQGQINGAHAALKENEDEMALWRQALDVLADYEYSADAQLIFATGWPV